MNGDLQKSGWAPNGATATGGVSVAVVGVLVWIMQAGLHITVPDDVVADFCLIAAFLGTYLHPDGRIPKE